MNGDHIIFQTMSDLYDGHCDEKEKKAVLAHFESCKSCEDEYRRLQKTLSLLADYGNRVRPFDDFADETIKRIFRNKKRRMLYKSLPAIAASFLIIVSFALSESGIFRKSATQVEISKEASVPGEAETVVNIIANHRSAKLIIVTDDYIEGEIPLYDYRKLRRELGPRKVRQTLVQQSQEPARSHKRNIEEVGMSDGHEDIAPKPEDKARLVRFRIYR